MNAHIGTRSVVEVGKEIVLESDTPGKTHGVVFEDDGETGYFYAREYDQREQLICDALHIYSVEGVIDRDKPSAVLILWTEDYSKAALLINSYPHAVFDFTAKCGYSRDNYPKPDTNSEWTHQQWSDSLRSLFA